MPCRPRLLPCVAMLLCAALQVSASAADLSRKSAGTRPITNPKFDETAERVKLFDGMKDGRLETKVIAQNAEHGSVLITNTTDETLTVELPEAFVAVKVLKQFGGMGGGMGGMGGGMGGMGGGMGGMGGGMGGQQNIGGGMGGGGMGGMGGMGGGGMGGMGGGGQGGGFFSIPPEKTVRVPFVSVCLNHGKADPTPQANYQMVPVDSYTQDVVLKELITMVGTGKLAPPAAQAAVWNRTDNMSWQDLASKVSYGVLGNKVPYFTSADLRRAQLISSTAVARIRERGEDPAPAATETVTVRGQRTPAPAN
ncbi:MAG: hypothetical protein R3C49_18255 [Planctomycetaceae bacterium]